MKVIDCFLFSNELDLLTYRLNVLNDIIDTFILVESRQTFHGKPKQLTYNDNKHIFEEFNHKIVHLIIEYPYVSPNIDYLKNEQWKNENYHRNCIKTGIETLSLNDPDLLIISDLDEIPDPNTLVLLKQSTNQNYICSLEQDLYYYNLNTRFIDKWYKSKILTYRKYKELNISCNDIRFYNCPILKNGGWHLSYFGDVNFIQNKIKVSAHQEYNNDTFTDVSKIENNVINHKDLFGRSHIGIQNISIQMNSYLPTKYEIYLKSFY
jgi:beta-1,4-mannosyl-glycoprotein beta-1,4-N-acetylglucosaminyltransferase